MVEGIDILRVLRRAIIRGAEHIGASNGIEPGARGDAANRRHVESDCLFQVTAVRADVGSSQQDAGRQLAFNGEVPVVEGWRLIAVSRVPADDKQVLSESSIGGRRERGRKQIGLWRATETRLRRGEGAERVTDCARFSTGSAKYELRAEGSYVHEPIVDNAGYARVIKNTGSAAQAGLAIAEHVVGEAEARRKVFQAGFHAIFGNARIAREVHTRRRVRKLCGMNASNQAAEPKLLLASFDFAPRKSWLITQTKVHRQASGYLVVVLGIDTGE